MKVSLILTCAGKGARAGFSKNKLLIPFNGQTVLEKSFNAFYQTNLIDEFIITSSTDDYNEVLSIIGDKAKIVIGGNTRTESVKNALKEVSGDIVLIHDGARPFVSERIILDTISSVKEFGSGIVAIPSADTIFSCSDNVVSNYLGKDGLYLVQTPQGFFTKDIVKAYDLANGISFNDDGEVYKNYIAPVHIVMGDKANVKLTYPADFESLEQIKDFRTGVGFDSHKLVENRPLILGGITIPHVKGLLGHSDADVLTHAIMDAMLSAVALRDIGYHFPDTDPAYKNADSMKLLEKVIELVKNKGYKIKSLSAVIMAEKPKLNPHIPLITKNLANALSLPLDSVGLGATTLEGLGFVGREEGICVHANCVLESI